MAADSLHRTTRRLGKFARRHGATHLEQDDQLLYNRITQQPAYAGLSVIGLVHRRPNYSETYTTVKHAATLRGIGVWRSGVGY
jgi:hypothetical protein